MGRIPVPGGMGLPVTMVRALPALALAALCIANSGRAQTPSLQLSGGAPVLTIAEATAGSRPQVATENTTRITIATGESAALLVSLDAPLPPGVTLRIKVEAPAGAMSMGFVALDSTPQEVVRGIAPGFYPSLTIVHELSAQSHSGTIPPSSCAITFSLTAES